MVVCHCSKCHHEWESTKIYTEYICDWCGAPGVALEGEIPNPNEVALKKTLHDLEIKACNNPLAERILRKIKEHGPKDKD
jgi:hypothetical protein